VFRFGYAMTMPDRLNHNGEGPGERSFVALRPDGGSMAVPVNSDDAPRAHDIIVAAAQFLDWARLRNVRVTRMAGPGYPGWRIVRLARPGSCGSD
jgi:hypothetical protein